MPLPTQSDVHVNRPLTNISIAMIQDTDNFVADKVFPNVPVQKQSDSYFVYDNAYWNSDEMQERGPAQESVGNGYTVDASNTYFAKRYSFHKDIDDTIRANADVPINLDSEATQYVTLKGLIKREKLFVSAFLASGIWTRDYAGVSGVPSTNQVLQWDDSHSTPIEDVWDAKVDVLQRTGFEPNVLVIGYPVLKELINHPEMVDRIKYTGTNATPAMVDLNALAQLFGVDKVVVMKSISNVAQEGATKSHQFIGGKIAGLFYASNSPGVMQPSAGYTFSWNGFLGAGAFGNRIKRIRMEQLSSDRVEIEMAFALKLIAADLGAFWTTIVS